MRTWNVANKIRELERTLDDAETLDEHYRDLNDAIENFGRNKTPHSLFRIASELDMVGLEASRSGALAVLQARPSGWKDIMKGLECSYWITRLKHQLVLAKQIKHGNALIAARVFIQCLAMNQDEWAAWFFQAIQEDVNKRQRRSFRGFPTMALGFFAVQLYAKWKGLEFSRRRKKRSIYDEVWPAWEDEEQLRTVLQRACDFHCEQAVAVSDDYEGEFMEEFAGIPLNVFPAEIIALQRVRQELGLSTPAIDHPLMMTRLCRIPKSIARWKDDMVTKAIAILKENLAD